MTISNLFVGVDVSKDALDVALWSAGDTPSMKALKGHPSKRFENSTEGFKAFHSWLQKQGSISLVLCESTGGYEQPLVEAMQQATVPVARINPSRARDFAKSLGKRAKTDAIDAAVLACYASVHQPEPLIAPDKDVMCLRMLHDRRASLTAIRAAEENRLKQAQNEWMQESINTHIRFLNDQIKEIELQTKKTIANSPTLKAKSRRLQTIPGVGPVLSTALLTHMPELGMLSGKEVSVLAGVAPINRDSGNSSGHRFCPKARRGIKGVLYMAAVSAETHNPVMKEFSKQISDNGRPKLVVLGACMRKLLTWANTLIKTEQDWSTEIGLANRQTAERVKLDKSTAKEVQSSQQVE